MAHHNSTPRSILEAPVSVPIVVVEHDGPNRQQRRHEAVEGNLPGSVVWLPRPTNVPKRHQLRATNKPLVKAVES